jgi:hypothetical protein
MTRCSGRGALSDVVDAHAAQCEAEDAVGEDD